MKSLFALTLLLLAATSSVPGQSAMTQPNQCTLTLTQSPKVRGLKLGMSLENVLALFPGSRDNQLVKNQLSSSEFIPRYGVISFGLLPGQYPTKENFTGIESLYFVFLDDQVVQYSIRYSQPPWPKLDDFVQKVAGAFHLPPADKWTLDKELRKNLACDGFKIQALTRDEIASLIVKTGAEPFEIQRERRAAAQAQARRDFKP